MTKELERTIEKYFVQGVRKLGGKAYKFVSPGNVGVPDRIVVWPDGSVEFVELKTKTGKLSLSQAQQIRQLRSLRCHAITLYGKDDVMDYLQGKYVAGELS